METCIYCHNEAHYQFKNKKWCCAPHMNSCPIIKKRRSKSTKETWKLELRGKNKKANKELNGINLCEYNCNKIAHYQLKNGKLCCSIRSNCCSEIRRKNSSVNKKRYETHEQELKGFAVSTRRKESWQKSHKSRIENLRIKPFEQWSKKARKEEIFKEQNGLCAECKQTIVWNGKILVFELDHIDGNRDNNARVNSRLLCPNCHSQTPTFKGRNKNKGDIKVSDEELLKMYKQCSNIRQTLIAVGLSAKGGNYKRIKRLLKNAAMGKLVKSSDSKSEVL